MVEIKNKNDCDGKINLNQIARNNNNAQIFTITIIIFTILTNNQQNLKINVENKEITFSEEIEIFFSNANINEILDFLNENVDFNNKNLKMIKGIYSKEQIQNFKITKNEDQCKNFYLLHKSIIKCLEILKI